MLIMIKHQILVRLIDPFESRTRRWPRIVQLIARSCFARSFRRTTTQKKKTSHHLLMQCSQCFLELEMGGSRNGGTPKWMVYKDYNGTSHKNRWTKGVTPIGNLMKPPFGRSTSEAWRLRSFQGCHPCPKVANLVRNVNDPRGHPEWSLGLTIGIWLLELEIDEDHEPHGPHGMNCKQIPSSCIILHHWFLTMFLTNCSPDYEQQHISADFLHVGCFESISQVWLPEHGPGWPLNSRVMHRSSMVKSFLQETIHEEYENWKPWNGGTPRWIVYEGKSH